MTTVYKFKAFFTQDGLGVSPSSAPVATVVDTDADTKLVDAQAATALTNLTGYYEYEYSGADDLDLVCKFYTSDSNVDQQDLVSYVVDRIYQPDLYKADVSALEATLDAIKGAGWSDEDLVAIKAAVDEVSTWTAANISSSITSGTITQVRGNSWSVPITGLTLDSNKIQLVIKRNKGDADSESILMVDTTTGLLYVNGANAADASKASLAYEGTTLTLIVDKSIAVQLPYGTWYFGIQSIAADGTVSEDYGGSWIIVQDTVKAIE